MKIDFLKGIKKGQEEFGETIAIVVNSALLSIVYFAGVGITSLFAKIFGNSFLDYKDDASKKSYWEELNLGKESLGEYCRQF